MNKWDINYNHRIAYTIDDMQLDGKTLVVYCGYEDTVRHNVVAWQSAAARDHSRAIRIVDQTKFSMEIETVQGETRSFPTIEIEALDDIIANCTHIICDCTSMLLSTWTSFMLAAKRRKLDFTLVYSEPEQYMQRYDPTVFAWYDLSVRTEPFGPVPGLARLRSAASCSKSLLALTIGFEGIRAQRACRMFDPMLEIIPVVGMPGYLPHYPAVSIANNIELFERDFIRRHVEWADASCPFDLLQKLKKIRRLYPDYFLRIAVVGTKPHQIGSIMFLLTDENSDVMHDYPVRRSGRDQGLGPIHVYHILDGGNTVA